MDQKIYLDVSYAAILKVMLAILLVALLFLVREVVLALFAAFVISTVVNPLADWAEKKKFPRVLATSLIFIVILVFVGLLFYTITPPLFREISILTRHFPQYVEENAARYPFLQDYSIKDNVNKIILYISNFFQEQALDLFVSTVSILSNLFYVFLVIAVSFYLTAEKNLVKNSFRKIVPANEHKDLVKILDEIESKMGRWLIGQIALSVVNGFIIFVGLLILGVPFALFLAILATILRFIPFVGSIISDSIGIIIALLISPMLGLATFLMYYLVQQMEAYILIPYVMERAVGLNPIVVITVIISGGRLAGITGALLAVPIAIVAMVLIEELFLKPKANDKKIAAT